MDMKLKEQKNSCFHTPENYYEDDDGDIHCRKCESEKKN